MAQVAFGQRGFTVRGRDSNGRIGPAAVAPRPRPAQRGGGPLGILPGLAGRPVRGLHRDHLKAAGRPHNRQRQ